MKAKRKKKKQSWFTKQIAKVQFLPWYWKFVLSVAIFFLVGTTGTQMFTAANDVMMVLGFVLLVVGLWFLIQLWLPSNNKK